MSELLKPQNGQRKYKLTLVSLVCYCILTLTYMVLAGIEIVLLPESFFMNMGFTITFILGLYTGGNTLEHKFKGVKNVCEKVDD